jgi:hypothetical protein
MTKKYYPRKPYEANHYKVGYHAIKRTKQYEIGKGEVGHNLTKKPLLLTLVRDRMQNGRKSPSYGRYSDNAVVTFIHPKSHKVKTLRRYRDRELLKEIQLKKEGK